MTDETTVVVAGEETPVVETEAPAAEAAAPAETTTDDAPKEEPKRRAWWQDRIDDLTRQKYGLASERDEAVKERDTLRALLGKPKDENAVPEPPQAPQRGENLTQADVDRLADQKLALQRHNERADAIRAKGREEHGDKFDEALVALVQAGVELGASPFVQAAMDTDAPEKVMYALGSDPEKAMKFAQMSPTKMAIEMDRLARELSAPPSREVSKAPAPSPEIRGASRKTVDLADPKTDTDDWMAARQKQVDAARQAGRRIQ